MMASDEKLAFGVDIALDADGKLSPAFMKVALTNLSMELTRRCGVSVDAYQSDMYSTGGFHITVRVPEGKSQDGV